MQYKEMDGEVNSLWSQVGTCTRISRTKLEQKKFFQRCFFFQVFLQLITINFPFFVNFTSTIYRKLC